MSSRHPSQPELEFRALKDQIETAFLEHFDRFSDLSLWHGSHDGKENCGAALGNGSAVTVTFEHDDSWRMETTVASSQGHRRAIENEDCTAIVEEVLRTAEDFGKRLGFPSVPGQ